MAGRGPDPALDLALDSVRPLIEAYCVKKFRLTEQSEVWDQC